MAPAFEQAAAQLEPHFRLVKVDTEAEQSLGARFNIRSIPTLALFKGGREVARQPGAMDANNIVVTAHNLRLDPTSWLNGLPAAAIGEYHLAGHAMNEADGETILIDDHGSPVADPVWALYSQTIARAGALPTLIEWDNDIPDFPILLAEAARAADILTRAEAPDEAAQRFAVYRNNVAHSLTRALARRFPVVERLVGLEFFTAMARLYIEADLPASPQLFLWGEGFARFLQGFPPVRSLAYLPD
eukprot:gene55409-73990_t